MQVVVDVVPVALGVPLPPQREVGVLQEQRAVQHTLLVDLRPGSLATTSRSRTQLATSRSSRTIPALLVLRSRTIKANNPTTHSLLIHNPRSRTNRPGRDEFTYEVPTRIDVSRALAIHGIFGHAYNCSRVFVQRGRALLLEPKVIKDPAQS